MAGSTIPLDVSRFPLVVTRFPPTWDDDQIQAYFAAVTRLHEREERFVHLTDLSAAEDMSSAAMRRRAAEFMAKERERSGRLCVAACQVSNSAVIRGAMRAIHWITPPPHKNAVFATFDEAVRWCLDEARAAGLAVPPA